MFAPRDSSESEHAQDTEYRRQQHESEAYKNKWIHQFRGLAERKDRDRFGLATDLSLAERPQL